MIFHTCFTNKSFHGYSSNVLKSGICKYVRRMEYGKLTWCIMELARFIDCTNPKSNALLTNLVNRLKILLMEELTPSEIGIIYQGILFLEEYDKDRSKCYLLLEFCELLKIAKRSRSVSYVNNWWRHKYEDYDLTPITELSDVVPFRKQGDSEEILILGENLIHFCHTQDERMFGIFTKLYKMEGVYGKRYRRKDACYLWFEIISSFITNEKQRVVFEFALDMFHRRTMTERPAFGIWVGFIVWKPSELTMTDVSVRSYELVDVLRFYDGMTKLILDDYVVNDYHVNQTLGLGHFAEHGAFVKQEDETLLDNMEEYREFYITKKHDADTTRKKKKKKNVSTPDVMKDVGTISWEDITEFHVIEEGVCSGKVPCIIVSYKHKKYVMKQMDKSMNYGIDYLLIDTCKRLFGLRDMNMKRVLCDYRICRRDKSKHTFVGNWDMCKKQSIYCMMDYWENIGDIGKHKHLLENADVMKECFKIRLFDGLFRSSDNILRNILVNKQSELLSIDEGDLFGKRLQIFNKRGDWCMTHMNVDIIQDILSDIVSDKDKKIQFVCELLTKYNMSPLIHDFTERFETYCEIVKQEIITARPELFS